MPGGNDSLLPALAAVGLHSAAMLAVAGVLAVVVYQKLGVEVLRRAWVNLDLIWVGALVVVGGMALGTRSVAPCRRLIEVLAVPVEKTSSGWPSVPGTGSRRDDVLTTYIVVDADRATARQQTPRSARCAGMGRLGALQRTQTCRYGAAPVTSGKVESAPHSVMDPS